jgi:NifU-like protein involved in Fe-S cluster formation
MSDPDLIKLYTERLLALAADIPLTDPIDAPQAIASKRAPMCGSEVTVALDLQDGRVSRFSQDVRACALGQAAASVLGGLVIGKTPDQLQRARSELAAMLKGGEVPNAPFEGFAVLLAARDYANRHASILLALDATLAASDAAQTQ